MSTEPKARIDEVLSVYQVVARVMQRMKAVAKDGTAPQIMGGFKYRRIEDVMNSLHDVMADEGLIIVPSVQSAEFAQVEKSVTVKMRTSFTVYGPRGDKIECGPILSEGKDTQDKAANKAHSSGFKTFLLQFFMIPTSDGLPNVEAGDSVDQAQPPARFGAGQANTRIEPRPNLAAVPNAAERAANNCASTSAPAGEPRRNTEAFEKLLTPPATKTAEPPPVTDKAADLMKAQAAIRKLIGEYLHDVQAPELPNVARQMLGVILPGKTTTDQLDLLDCDRVRLCITMLPRVPGNTVADVNAFLISQWQLGKIPTLTAFEVEVAFKRIAEAIAANAPDLTDDDIPF